MNIRVVKPLELAAHEVQLWKDYQCQDALLSNPFLCPEYVQAVSEVQTGLEVAIIEDDAKVVGFFPFQRIRSIGHPVGLRLCDISTPILKTGVAWDPDFLVRACGLSGWHFQNLISSETTQRHEWFHARSPYLDLRGGFDQYRRERIEDGSRVFEEVARKSRKLQREIGPLRFEFHTNDNAVFDQLLEWKKAQRERTNTFNVLNMNWAQALLKRIQMTQTADFAGVLSTLYAGDQLAAVHLGMRGRSVLHYWIPTYNPSLSRYSPGSILLLETARHAATIGISRLDLGTGNEQYKERFKSGSFILGFGSVDCGLGSSVLSLIRRASHKCNRFSPVYIGIASIKTALQRVYYRTLQRHGAEAL